MSDEEYGDSGGGTETLTRDSVETKEPAMYRVLLLNDNYTTMDFVVAILENVFRKSPAEATQIMLKVHNQGRGLAGTYPKDIAEAKVETVHARAMQEGHPLKCTIEKE